MSKVIAGFSMSLDGFVADPDDGVDQVFKWYSAGGTDAEVMAGDGTFEMSREGAEFISIHLIRVTEKAFDDFAGGAVDKKQIKRALGLR